ncbi:hypothetical protein FHW58_000940 [Duganella sp. 1224]|uniref:hypothetical protein n=1 Tax=Duganella sp. 1224 TaxID=2587052 RepID=UPI0015C72E96|nr:hypothetical protein [Duganella sp. 1224]NYE59788.1 hypothetical protein [Duganella sp. 1224]
MVWLRNVALTALAFGGSWGGAIWFWRETNRMPATSELVLYLLVLPLLLLTAWWAGRKAWARATAPAAPEASTIAGNASTATEALAAAPLPAALTIAATAVRAPHGESVDELRAALAEHRARPQLDSELYDDEGYPILSARLPDAGDAALREELEQWRRQQQLDDPRLDAAQWRALGAASAVLTDLMAHTTLHRDLAPWLEQQQARQQGRLPPDTPAAVAPPVLQLLVLWPAEWQPAQRDLGWQWLRLLATQAGWPQSLIAPAMPQQDDDAGALLAQLLQRAANPRQPTLALVMAAASQLSDSAVSRLSNQNALYTAARPQGHIPGEGAAGLLLADAVVARQLDADGCVLQAVHTGRRAASADTVKRDTDTCLSSAIADVLKEAQVDGAAIELVTADTGHRTTRVTELMHVVTAAAPQLDPGADVISMGTGSGSCGAVAWLTALAVADAEVRQRGGPALSISNEDPYRRSAALVRPAPAA